MTHKNHATTSLRAAHPHRRATDRPTAVGPAFQTFHLLREQLSELPRVLDVLDDIQEALNRAYSLREGRLRMAPGPILSRATALSEGGKALDPNILHEAALLALQKAGEPIKTATLLPILKETFQGVGASRLTLKQAYWALEYRRRTFGDVDRRPGGVWYVKGH